MADPLRHSCKLDVAEEILAFIAENPDAEWVRGELRKHLEMEDRDFEHAHEVVKDIVDLKEEQEY